MIIHIITNYFKEWSIFERVWLFIFTATILVLSIYWKDSIIGITASLTGIWCVILVARGKISNYYFGIVNVITYAIVAYGWNYYGDVMLNLAYFLPMQFVGLYLWSKNKSKQNTVTVRHLSNIHRIVSIFIIVILVYTYGLLLEHIGGSLPLVDSATTILSVAAMLLMAFMYTEQWILWIIIDVLSIIMWAAVLQKGGTDISVLIMWIAYLINAIYGFYNWIRLERIQKESNQCLM